MGDCPQVIVQLTNAKIPGLDAVIQVRTKNPIFVCVSFQVVINTPSIQQKKTFNGWFFQYSFTKHFYKPKQEIKKVILYYKHLEV